MEQVNETTIILTKEASDEAIRKYGRDYLTRLCEEANERRNEIRANKGLPPISQKRIRGLIAKEREGQLERMRERNAEPREHLQRDYKWCKDNNIRPALDHHLWSRMSRSKRQAFIRGWHEMVKEVERLERRRKERMEERRSRGERD